MEMSKKSFQEYLINMKKLNFAEIIEKNKKKLFSHNRNSDFAEAMMEFGALICRPQEPICENCQLKINVNFINR